jgi:hypothetical protein
MHLLIKDSGQRHHAVPTAFFIDLFVSCPTILEEIELEEAFVQAVFPFHLIEMIFVLHLTEVHCGHKELQVYSQMVGSLPLIIIFISIEFQLEAMPETLSEKEYRLPTLGWRAALAFKFNLGAGELINGNQLMTAGPEHMDDRIIEQGLLLYICTYQLFAKF